VAVIISTTTESTQWAVNRAAEVVDPLAAAIVKIDAGLKALSLRRLDEDAEKKAEEVREEFLQCYRRAKDSLIAYRAAFTSKGSPHLVINDQEGE